MQHAEASAVAWPAIHKIPGSDFGPSDASCDGCRDGREFQIERGILDGSTCRVPATLQRADLGPPPLELLDGHGVGGRQPFGTLQFFPRARELRVDRCRIGFGAAQCDRVWPLVDLKQLRSLPYNGAFSVQHLVELQYP